MINVIQAMKKLAATVPFLVMRPSWVSEAGALWVCSAFFSRASEAGALWVCSAFFSRAEVINCNARRAAIIEITKAIDAPLISHSVDLPISWRASAHKRARVIPEVAITVLQSSCTLLRALSASESLEFMELVSTRKVRFYDHCFTNILRA